MPNTLHLFPSEEVITMSAFPESPTGFLSMEATQLQELKLQILIYRYMLAGTAVPHHLLLQIKKTIVRSAPFLYNYQPLQLYSDQYHHQPPPLFCWGRSSIDPEPGRCRRTDGKKWRCSRDVVAEQKYCERHVHRGRNRSRKPVEIPTTTMKTTMSGLKHNSPESITETNDNRSSSSEIHVLRHFFDSGPRHDQESGVVGINANARCLSSATTLSMSMPGVLSSDVSLKLSTGGDELCYNRACKRDPHNYLALTGGPLAEALRSSTSNASPTSVLNQLPRACGSEISFV